MNDIVKCPNCQHPIDIKHLLSEDMKHEMNQKYMQLKDKMEQEQNQKILELQKREQELEGLKKTQNEQMQLMLKQKQQELETELSQKMKAQFDADLASIKQENEQKSLQLQQFKQKELDLLKKEKDLADKAAEADLHIQKTLLEKETQIRQEAEERAKQKAAIDMQERERDILKRKEEMDFELARRVKEKEEEIKIQEQLKTHELQQKLDQQKKLLEEMQKKATQGSMQTQGEAQELLLEEILQRTFPHDSIQPVAKGVRGADSIQLVRNSMGQECGQIMYESKRTKDFSASWIDKLKQDMRAQRADIAVIVTEALPADMTRFGQKDGVWICTFAEVKSVAMVLRDGLIRIQAVAASQENKADKMVMLYNYLTSNDFKQSIEAIVEAFTAMQTQLLAERKQQETQWKKREVQLQKVIESTISMYGSMKGIAGGAIQNVIGLESPMEEEDSNNDLLN